MTLYERLKEIQGLIGCAVQVEESGQWLTGEIHEIELGKEIRIVVESPPLHIQLVGVDEIHRRMKAREA